jgi:putative endonuclease
MLFPIYILYSEKADRYYIGQTSDIKKRMHDHNHPVANLIYTAKYIPGSCAFQLVLAMKEGML